MNFECLINVIKTSFFDCAPSLISTVYFQDLKH